MARAAAKRRAPARQDHHGRERRPGGGAGVEQTLFFQRIRRQAKWVFVFLAVVFAGSFVVYGVGSGSTGIGDLFRGDFGGIFGGSSSSSGPSIEKAEKKIRENPKNAQAYLDLAHAYQAKENHQGAIDAFQRYLQLKPKSVDALQSLAGEYYALAQSQYADLQAIQFEAQATAPTTFGPAPNTPLGKAFGNTPDPILQAVSQAANVRFNEAQQRLQSTLQTQEQVQAKIVKLTPSDPESLIAYAQSAQQAGDTQTAIDAYKKFLKKFPDDLNAPLAKQQLKTLTSQVTQSSSG